MMQRRLFRYEMALLDATRQSFYLYILCTMSRQLYIDGEIQQFFQINYFVQLIQWFCCY